jgi:hypothetical protein
MGCHVASPDGNAILCQSYEAFRSEEAALQDAGKTLQALRDADETVNRDLA